MLRVFFAVCCLVKVMGSGGRKMDVFAAIEIRRAVKHYDPSHRMTEEEVQKLFSLAVLSPTAFNIQNWRFVVVRDAELRK